MKETEWNHSSTNSTFIYFGTPWNVVLSHELYFSYGIPKESYKQSYLWYRSGLNIVFQFFPWKPERLVGLQRYIWTWISKLVVNNTRKKSAHLPVNREYAVLRLRKNLPNESYPSLIKTRMHRGEAFNEGSYGIQIFHLSCHYTSWRPRWWDKSENIQPAFLVSLLIFRFPASCYF